MSIYAIGDLHLSFGVEKPMDIFGGNWINYEKKLENNWNLKINENDTVLLLGDFSWAMNFEEVKKDFDFLNKLNGKKIFIKGNHDYWWNSLTKMKKFVKENDYKNIDFLYNNSFQIEGKLIVGTRGWNFLKDELNSKIRNREVMRLETSIKDGIEKYGNDSEKILIIHYPPLMKENLENEFTEILKKYKIKKCFYGHLHGEAHKEGIEGSIGDTEYKMVSSDYLDFDPILVKDE